MCAPNYAGERAGVRSAGASYPQVQAGPGRVRIGSAILSLNGEKPGDEKFVRGSVGLHLGLEAWRCSS